MADTFSSSYGSSYGTSSDSSSSSADTPEQTPRRRKRAGAAGDWSDTLAPLQVRLPADMIRCLKLIALENDQQISELVLQYLTSSDQVSKVWVAGRRSA
jgi:hypothetical protein